MGDVSSEPSMEEILSSIKRVIEESDAPGNARRRAPRPIAPQGEDEILELKDPVSFSPAEPSVEQQPSATPQAVTPPPRVSDRFVDRSTEATQQESRPEPTRTESLVSPGAEQASREPLAALSRLIVKPDVAGSDTLEGMVREMLRPMLRDWLDANLPAVVETMVSREIARISGRGEG